MPAGANGGRVILARTADKKRKNHQRFLIHQHIVSSELLSIYLDSFLCVCYPPVPIWNTNRRTAFMSRADAALSGRRLSPFVLTQWRRNGVAAAYIPPK
jgi:hypothetical protein